MRAAPSRAAVSNPHGDRDAQPLRSAMQKTMLTVLALGLALAVPHAAGAQTTTPTFSKDVAPILYKNCTSCHRPGEIAPMSLLTYKDARPRAKDIRDEVSEGHMPPWHADAPDGTFLNERHLTAAEKNTLLAWVANGAPRGDS